MNTLAFGYVIPAIRAYSGLPPVRQCSCRAYYKATANIRNEYSRLFFHRADISPLIDEMKLIGIESLFFDLFQNPDQHLRR